MTPETRKRAKEALKLIQAGTPVQTACAKVGAGVGALYTLYGREVAVAQGERAALRRQPIPEYRDRAIVALRMARWSNGDIGKAFGVSAQYVGELISKILLERRKSQPPVSGT